MATPVRELSVILFFRLDYAVKDSLAGSGEYFFFF